MVQKFITTIIISVFFGVGLQLHSMDPDEGINNYTSNAVACFKRLGGACMSTVYENPICTSIGIYYLGFDRETIKDNTFWSAIFGSCLVASFVKNLFYPKSSPKNFIVKTAVENPFFTFVAGHMLLLHRNLICQYPIETMVIGGSLFYALAKNYKQQVEGIEPNNDFDDKV